MTTPIQETAQLAQDDWPGSCATFSSENRGQPVRVEVFGMEVGDQPLSDARPFAALDYDPPGKGHRCTSGNRTSSLTLG